MPDILIRGLEMPTSCTKCPFEAFGDCYGGKVKRIMDIEDYMERGERHPECPLVELPEHGDLIDRDALVEEQKLSRDYHAQNSREESLLERAIRIVREAPVVVPAERGDADA